MPAGKYNIQMEQGSTFDLTIVWQDPNNAPRDLTGYSAQMQIRENYLANTALTTLSTSNNEIKLFGNTGTIVLSLPASRTAAIPVDFSSDTNPPTSIYVYDLELIGPDARVTKIIRGNVVISGEVTRI